MIKARMKKLRLARFLPILGVMILPLFFILFQSRLSAYANTSLSMASKHANATVEAIMLNLREKPGMSSRIIGELKLGTRITIYEEQSGWAKITTPSGQQGWIYEYYIAKDARDIPASSAGPKQDGQKLLAGKTVVLDPGHGGIDSGTTSIAGTPEKTLTLATAMAVEQKLKSAGANVIMTRSSDKYLTLQQSVNPSNQYDADAFISFHYNWSDDPSANGLTDFYYHQSKDDPLAADILHEVAKTTGLPSDGTSFDDLYVLRNNSRPSTLIELGFLSNTHDDSVVESAAYQNNVAEGVYLGLLDYFKK